MKNTLNSLPHYGTGYRSWVVCFGVLDGYKIVVHADDYAAFEEYLTYSHIDFNYDPATGQKSFVHEGLFAQMSEHDPQMAKRLAFEHYKVLEELVNKNA